MESCQINRQEEEEYLENTLNFIRQEIEKEFSALEGRKDELIKLRREMWENTAHHSADFEKLTEITQYLSSLDTQTASYGSTVKRIEKYKRMLFSPYFGRFDFTEEGCRETDRIYIGIHTVIDVNTHDIFVYDWRAPVSVMYYEYEPGPAEYSIPGGKISGRILFKRQYKVINGKLVYFFDSSLKIDDEMLQQALYRTSSSKMRNMVETIQKEQNAIIRDTENELLIVQGVAGSGKTSVALHHIAFLLYHGVSSALSSNNIIIISPNEVFSRYISSVIPELGEENVERSTFGEIIYKLLGDRFKTEKRNEQLELLIACKDTEEAEQRKNRMEFKGSLVFADILDRLIRYYEQNIIEFEDIYYDGRLIETRQMLKNMFLNGTIAGSTAKRLERIEKILLDKIHPLQKGRLERVEKQVLKMEGHEFDAKPFSRLLSIKESGALYKKIQSFTRIDYLEIYRFLFKDKSRFFKLSKGLKLPDYIEKLIETTNENLRNGYLEYEDCAALMYLKLRLEGSGRFLEVKQVVIDEAQDYTPMQYKVFKLMFGKSRFTVLGDIRQSIDREGNMALYDTITEIFEKNKTTRLFLNKSYRSSYEINAFSRKISGPVKNYISFERHGKEPSIIQNDSVGEMDMAVIGKTGELIEEGFETIAIICKTAEESKKLYTRLKVSTDIKMIESEEGEICKGITVLPSYMAKGLEFDAVIVYGVSADNYCNVFDRRLLYIACTRALHRLALFYTGSKSPFI